MKEIKCPKCGFLIKVPSSIEEKILESLKEKPKTFYDLYKKERLASNKTVLEALHALARNGFIYQERENKGRRRIFYFISKEKCGLSDK